MKWDFLIFNVNVFHSQEYLRHVKYIYSISRKHYSRKHNFRISKNILYIKCPIKLLDNFLIGRHWTIQKNVKLIIVSFFNKNYLNTIHISNQI